MGTVSEADSDSDSDLSDWFSSPVKRPRLEFDMEFDDSGWPDPDVMDVDQQPDSNGMVRMLFLYRHIS
jgi:hypothetical protein